MTDITFSKRAFTPSPTLLICSIAGLVAVIGLFLPSLSPLQTDPRTAAPYGGDTGADASAGSADGDIQIVDFSYTGDLAVGPGETIQVLNADGVPHTLTADDGSFDTGVIGGDAAGSFSAPGADGTYSFICTIHPSMSGELTVSS